jgi:hypothetical protein
MAQNFVTTAKDQLKVFDPGNTRDVLMMLADYALIRKV